MQNSRVLIAHVQRSRALNALVQLSRAINALACAKCTRTARNEHASFIANLLRHVRICAFNCKLAHELYRISILQQLVTYSTAQLMDTAKHTSNHTIITCKAVHSLSLVFLKLLTFIVNNQQFVHHKQISCTIYPRYQSMYSMQKTLHMCSGYKQQCVDGRAFSGQFCRQQVFW